MHSGIRFLVASLFFFLFHSCATYPPLGVTRIREYAFTSPKISASQDGYTIAFVSDIHFGNNFSPERFTTLVQAIQNTHPDIILIGGDNTLSTRHIRQFAQIAGKLTAPDGVYAVLGNHDFYNGRAATIKTLRSAGILVLEETSFATAKGISITGINDFRDVFPVIQKMKDIVDVERFSILVNHNPDFVEKISDTERELFDLVVSGHTHGGQITFFGYAPILPSEYGQKYRSGLVLKENTPVIVSNGAGFGGKILRFRLGAPSDFLLIRLRSPEHKSN